MRRVTRPSGVLIVELINDDHFVQWSGPVEKEHDLLDALIGQDLFVDDLGRTDASPKWSGAPGCRVTVDHRARTRARNDD